MWSDALEMLARAERMQRQFFPLSPPSAVAWEPPVDVLETERAVLVLVAVPGVDLNKVEALIEAMSWSCRASEPIRPKWGRGIIHRLELPQGRFERRIRLPPGR